jgi:hypothetical protein
MNENSITWDPQHDERNPVTPFTVAPRPGKGLVIGIKPSDFSGWLTKNDPLGNPNGSGTFSVFLFCRLTCLVMLLLYKNRKGSDATFIVASIISKSPAHSLSIEV